MGDTLNPAGQSVAQKKLFVRGMFDRLPVAYDLLNRILSFGLDSGWRKAVAREVPVHPGGRVLDLCCGTGDLTRLIREQTGQTVYPLDFSLAMLQKGKKKGKLNNLSLVADASQLPYAAKSFDCVTIAFGIRNIPDMDNLCRNVLYVLKEGGVFIILELTRPGNRFLRFLHYIYLSSFLPLIGGIVSGRFSEYRYLGRSVLGFCGPGRLRAVLQANGFSEVTTSCKSFGAVTVFICTKGT